MMTESEAMKIARKASQREKRVDKKIYVVFGGEKTLRDLFHIDDCWKSLSKNMKLEILMGSNPSLSKESTYYLVGLPFYCIINILSVKDGKKLLSKLLDTEYAN